MKENRSVWDDGSRPDFELRHCVEYALKMLDNDKTIEFSDALADGFTFEELLGTLLLARDACDRIDELGDEY